MKYAPLRNRFHCSGEDKNVVKQTETMTDSEDHIHSFMYMPELPGRHLNKQRLAKSLRTIGAGGKVMVMLDGKSKNNNQTPKLKEIILKKPSKSKL